MNDALVYLSVNGQAEMLPLSEARVPVLDRGFIFGDGIYEVVPVYHRVPFRMDEHLARLARNLSAIRIANPHDAAGWKDLIARLIGASDLEQQTVYIQVTRGVAKRAHGFPADAVPTVFLMSNAMTLPAAQLRAAGAAAITAVDNRWLRCDIKSISLLGNVLLAQQAVEAGVTETILFRDGCLTEASSSNVWVVQHGVLLAPPLDHRILEGIRYSLIEELARRVGIVFTARPITEAEVRAADELLLSSASKEILAVTRLDGKPIGSGRPGPVYDRLYAAYQQAKEASRHG